MARSVVESSLEARAEAVAFLSSMSVYGTVTVPIVTEDTPPRDPDPYGSAKRDAELMLSDAVARGLGSGLAIRLPGTVGRGSHHNFLSDALASILGGATVRARNPDAPFNNIVYVGDLVRFLQQWIERPLPGFNVINLGAEQPMSIRDVLSRLFALCKREQRLVFEPGGKTPFLISIERAKSLGYRPASVGESLGAFVRDATAT
jgi:nucleoside-diphosphate-sugar epimerase